MQDRFKFRVWCENKKQWEKDEILISSLNHYVVNTTERRCITTEEPKFHTICQCTGLKDKNGKLIYEGDIVKFKHGITIKVGEVQYSKTIWNISNSNFVQGAWYSGALINLYKECEVIGNIYENPELLQGG